jgi:hypothetical protein
MSFLKVVAWPIVRNEQGEPGRCCAYDVLGFRDGRQLPEPKIFLDQLPGLVRS